MIKIALKDKTEVFWEKEDYTDYMYDGKCFIIIKEKQWVGIYNIDSVVSIVCK